MNKIKCIVLVLAASASVWAQSSTEILAQLRPGVAWRVEALPDSERVLGEDSDPPADPVPGRVIETNQIGKGFRERTIHHPDGRKETRIMITNTQLTSMPDGTYQFYIPVEDEPAQGAAQSTLEGFGWLEERWIAGRAIVDGTECSIYAAPWPLGAEADASQEETEPRRFIRAAIGVNDRLPRRLESPFAVQRYVFEELETIPAMPGGALDFLLEDRERGERNTRRYRIPQ